MENAAWALIGLASAAYITQRHANQKTPLPPVPSAQREVDPTRWRHDGTQPYSSRDGNRSISQSVFEEETELRDLLAFA